MQNLKNFDNEIYDLIIKEEERQIDKIRLIASENYVTRAVLEASGTVLTNKYSEGYPRKRYYEGQQFIDPIEEIAIERAKELFGADHANVQPYSGSPANLAVYLAFVKPGETVMGMALPHGGHLTHGSPVSITGKFFNIVSYELDEETGLLNYDTIRKLALENKPKMIIAGHSAYPRQLDFKKFREIADEVGAILFVDMAHFAGLVAAGAHPSPVPYADVVTTTTHKTLRGPRGGMILCKEQHKAAIDKAVFPGIQGGPHNHTTAAIAVALKEAMTPEFKEYGHQVVKNAKVMAEELLKNGFNLVTGGTDNHLLLIDLTNKNVTGKQAAKALDDAGVVLNCNAVPYDKRKPFDPSGIRLGLAAVTSRGFKEEETRKTAQFISAIIDNWDNEEFLAKTAAEVKELCRKFPPPGLD
jgi:glycine hydroxymethyltransferase